MIEVRDADSRTFRAGNITGDMYCPNVMLTANGLLIGEGVQGQLVS